jgi:hypothetical protein
MQVGKRTGCYAVRGYKVGLIEGCCGLLRRLSVQFRENPANSFIGSSSELWRQVHGDRLPGIDGDGIENDVAFAALHIEGVEEIFDTDVVGGERRGIVGGEAWRGAGDGSRRVPVVGGVDEDDVAGFLQRLKQNESASAAIEALHVRGEGMFFERPDNMDADAFVAHDHIAEPQHQSLFCLQRHLAPHPTLLFRTR